MSNPSRNSSVLVRTELMTSPTHVLAVLDTTCVRTFVTTIHP